MFLFVLEKKKKSTNSDFYTYKIWGFSFLIRLPHHLLYECAIAHIFHIVLNKYIVRSHSEIFSLFESQNNFISYFYLVAFTHKNLLKKIFSIFLLILIF